jgi:hypothetical protein
VNAVNAAGKRDTGQDTSSSSSSSSAASSHTSGGGGGGRLRSGCGGGGGSELDGMSDHGAEGFSVGGLSAWIDGERPARKVAKAGQGLASIGQAPLDHDCKDAWLISLLSHLRVPLT